MSILSLCDRLTVVAAFCHDIGKLTKAFQAKLRRTMAGADGLALTEFIRHDAMSYFVIRKLMEGQGLEGLKQLSTLPGEQLQELIRVSSAASLKAELQAYVKSDLDLLSGILSPAPASPHSVNLSEVAAALVAYLSLTHHKLPGTFRTAEFESYRYLDSFSANCYVHDSLASEFEDCLTIQNNVFASDVSLGQGLATAVDELAEELTAGTYVDLKALISASLVHCRPTMVLGDHLASALKGTSTGADLVLANLQTEIQGTKEVLVPGDTLVTHVLSVVAHTRAQLASSASLLAGDLHGYPTLSTQASGAIASMRSSTGPFAWQHKAHEHIKEHHQGLPSFVVVTAGTGSGKTILSAQAMDALGSTRYTYALGLRSLTLQTGKSYQDDLGLTPADLAVVIGDLAAKKAFSATTGSESLAQDQLIVVSPPVSCDWMNPVMALAPGRKIEQACSASDRNFISAPVVVCTVDQLIGVTNLRTVRKAMRYKRVQSADLILDEVDNYSPDELKQLYRLCFATGYARKNLVCLSATMGVVHVQALYEAYRAGIELNNALTARGMDIFVCSISNMADPSHVITSASEPISKVVDHTMAINDTVIAAQTALPRKVSMDLLPISALDYAGILASALTKHAENSVDCMDIQASVGFIRMSTVSSARKLARHLMETDQVPADTEISVITYHSKYTALQLSMLDRVLNALTNRKRLPAGQEFSAVALETIIAPLMAAAPGKKNYVLIVVTTSIIETGRDHDYDWAILEPNSVRSLIQSGGRVRRHRGPCDQINVGLIETPARVLLPRPQTDPIEVYARPGPFTPIAVNPKRSSWGYTVKTAAKALGASATAGTQDHLASSLMRLFPGGAIRSAAALVAPSKIENAFQCVEMNVLNNALLATCKTPNLQVYSNAAAGTQQANGMFLTDWAYQRHFRSSPTTDAPPVLIAHRSKDQGLVLTNAPVTAAGTPSTVIMEKVNLASNARALMSVVRDGQALALELQELQAVLSASEMLDLASYTFQSYSTKAQCHYHPLLGFDGKSSET